MSRSRRRAAAGIGLAAAGLLLAPSSTAAHAVGGTFQLPVPLWLYLAGAAVAVAASFVVTALVSRADGGGRANAGTDLSLGLATIGRWLLRILGLAWWYGAIAVGYLIGDISPLPAVLFWIGIWVGLPIIAVLVGNPWPSLSPFRTTHAALDALAHRLGASRGLDAGLPYPAGLGRWPAVALLAVGLWAELVLPGSERAGTVATLMLGITVLTLAGMAAFGQVAWLRNGEPFEVLLGWFGRVGPIGRRAVEAALCDGCGAGCDPTRCVDCPECAVAADDRERRPILRAPFTGLVDVGRPGLSDAAFIVLALAGVTFDGMRETAFGATLVGAIQPVAIELFGTTGTAFVVTDTVVFATVIAAFAIGFGLITAAAYRLADADRRGSFGELAGRSAATLLPIAGGYLIAHYLTLVIQGAVWLPSLLADPLMGLAPVLDWIPTALVWYVSVVAIVGGHVAGIVLAHRLALRDAPRHAVVAGLPMVTLMIGYTVLSLWIIAQPIVVEPGVAPAAFR
jgi:hypothetical protein